MLSRFLNLCAGKACSCRHLHLRAAAVKGMKEPASQEPSVKGMLDAQGLPKALSSPPEVPPLPGNLLGACLEFETSQNRVTDCSGLFLQGFQMILS